MGLGDFLGNVFGAHTDEVKPVVQAQQIGPDGKLLGQQQSFAQALQEQMAGKGPSVAGAMLNAANEKNAAATTGMAAAQRGVNPGLAMRQAQMTNANANQQTANQAATARMQEQLNATGMLGGQLNTMQNQYLGAQQANQNATTAANQVNAGVSVDNTHTNNNVAGGVYSGIGGFLGLGGSGKAHGGYIQKLYDGGISGLPFQNSDPNPYAHFFGSKPQLPGGGAPSDNTVALNSAPDGAVDLLTEMGPAAAMALKSGGSVPGKAKVAGDSPKNDVVPTLLSPGEVVIPRSVAQHPGFIDALKKHLNQGTPEMQGFARVLAARKGAA